MPSTNASVRARSGVSATNGSQTDASASINSFVRRMRLRILLLRIAAGRAPNVEHVLKTLKQ
jgi:hypothetical protein